MTFKPRSFKDPQTQEKKPAQPVGKWNPPVREPMPPVQAVIEPNYVSTTTDPLRKITRKPRG
jgi:hypothetical protein